MNAMVNTSMDWLNTETIKRPPTLVIIPPKNKTHDYIVDIKYADFTGIHDISSSYAKAECYIVPPYKPLMYVSLYSPESVADIYAIRGITHFPPSPNTFNIYDHFHFNRER